MKVIDKIFNELEDIISNAEYRQLENEKLEIKDYCFYQQGYKINWDSLMESICSFLNSGSGIIILGIHEDKENKKYELKGYDNRNDNSLRESLHKIYDDENKIKDITGQIYMEEKELLKIKLKVIYVEELKPTEKFVFYNCHAYQRMNESDVTIGSIRIQAQKNYKKERQDKKEIEPVTTSTLDDMDIEKLKNYILLVNSEFPVYELFTNLKDATSFLSAKGMFFEKNPTILGLLVCGKMPGDFLGFRSQVNAHVDLLHNLPINQKSANDTVLKLIEQNHAFVFRNIQTGISIDKGGTKVYEYPEQLIRECINNSLAHRDYSINAFVSINIVPFKHIEIKNPGRFKAELLIHDSQSDINLKRIITTDQRPNNPELARILNVYNKWEGKGIGMKNLIAECLNDNIDLPYYIFHSWEMLSLFIPKGHLVDSNLEYLFDLHSKYISDKLDNTELSNSQKKVFSFFYKSEIANKNDKWTLLLTKNNNHFDEINALEESGLIYKHSSSNEIHNIYVVDRIFFKKNYNQELRLIFGTRFDSILNSDHRIVLSTIYVIKNFSLNTKISAGRIGEYLYFKLFSENFIQKEFENYKRKIRKIVEQLTEDKFLLPITNTTAKGNIRKIDYELNYKLNK